MQLATIYNDSTWLHYRKFSVVMASHEVDNGQFIYMSLLHVNTTCGSVVMRLGLSARYIAQIVSGYDAKEKIRNGCRRVDDRSQATL